MTKLYAVLLLSLSLMLSACSSQPEKGTGLEIDEPQQLWLIYTIDSPDVELDALKQVVEPLLAEANISHVQRPDAQLVLRVEKHAGEHLLYLDFSRQVSYQVLGKTMTKDGFVWGRFIKDIDQDELTEDVVFLVEEFIQAYTKANHF